MKCKAEKWLLFLVFSGLKNNKDSRRYGCSNKAKNRVLRTFRLGLLENLTWWSNYDPGFGFYAENYFGNDLQLFQNKTMQTFVIDNRILSLSVSEKMLFCTPMHFEVRRKETTRVLVEDEESRAIISSSALPCSMEQNQNKNIFSGLNALKRFLRDHFLYDYKRWFMLVFSSFHMQVSSSSLFFHIEIVFFAHCIFWINCTHCTKKRTFLTKILYLLSLSRKR